jgi:hypothetical protein
MAARARADGKKSERPRQESQSNAPTITEAKPAPTPEKADPPQSDGAPRSSSRVVARVWVAAPLSCAADDEQERRSRRLLLDEGDIQTPGALDVGRAIASDNDR